MGLVKFVINKQTKGFLQQITAGDLGSTIIGAIALGLLSMQVDFDMVKNLFVGEITTPEITESCKVVAGIGLGVYAWFTGKREKKNFKEILASAEIKDSQSD